MPSRVSVVLAALALAGCGGDDGHLRAASANYEETGLASWYGEEAAGAPTASGMPFDPAAITAAHRTLPLGSFAEVTALETGRRIVVLVNDRGPGRRDRLIDLSRGAAQQLGLGGQSMAPVRVRAVLPTRDEALALRSGREAPARAAGMRRMTAVDWGTMPSAALPASDGRYLLQVASFSSAPRARALAAALGGEAVAAGTLWRVRLGPYDGAAAAQRARDAVAARGYGDARIVPAD